MFLTTLCTPYSDGWMFLTTLCTPYSDRNCDKLAPTSQKYVYPSRKFAPKCWRKGQIRLQNTCIFILQKLSKFVENFIKLWHFWFPIVIFLATCDNFAKIAKICETHENFSNGSKKFSYPTKTIASNLE